MKSGPDTERREEEWRWVGFTMAGLASAGGRRRRSALAADAAAAAWDPPWLQALSLCVSVVRVDALFRPAATASASSGESGQVARGAKGGLSRRIEMA
jgi:hypothetical protein